MSTEQPPTAARSYLHEPDRYGYGGRPEDCRFCGAISPDYCPKHQCELDTAHEAQAQTARSNDNRPRPIPVPKGGFSSNAEEARWLEQTILLRLHEVLNDARVKATITPAGLYDLILMCMNSASTRRV